MTTPAGDAGTLADNIAYFGRALRKSLVEFGSGVFPPVENLAPVLRATAVPALPPATSRGPGASSGACPLADGAASRHHPDIPDIPPSENTQKRSP